MDQRTEKEEEPCHHIGRDMKLSYYEIQDTHTETLIEVLKY